MRTTRTTLGRRSPDVLGRRELNRALLERQCLLRRTRASSLAAVEHLVGLQAQIPENPYVALWSRLENFRPEKLSRLIASRKAVRIALMRSTIHLVSARDCLALRPLTQPALERSFRGGHARRLAGTEVAEITRIGRGIVQERPRTFAELGAVLSERWPNADRQALAQAVRTFVPLVQIPPRGLWRGSGAPRHASAEQWLDAPLDTASSVEKFILRYLAAFGPASVADAQAWSGAAGWREHFERLRPRLRVFRDEAGRELFDLPDAPRPAPDTPAPPRFLPEYDNVLLGHADRTRIIAEEHRKFFLGANGNFFGTVLVDGFVAARWRIEREPKRDRETLAIETLARFSAANRTAVAEEGFRLLAFLSDGAGSFDVRVRRVG